MATFSASQGFVPSGAEIPGNISILGAVTSRVPKPPTRGLYARRTGGGDKPYDESGNEEDSKSLEKQQKNIGALLMLMVVVFITIIIFVTVIAAYDIIREKITNTYAKEALMDKRSRNKKEDVDRTILANKKAYEATVSFGVFTIILALGVLPILFVIYYKLASLQ